MLSLELGAETGERERESCEVKQRTEYVVCQREEMCCHVGVPTSILENKMHAVLWNCKPRVAVHPFVCFQQHILF